jgi:hypothetical protein
MLLPSSVQVPLGSFKFTRTLLGPGKLTKLDLLETIGRGLQKDGYHPQAVNTAF